ncbi:MAG: M48 family metalloprotease [Proteobacteria bacterium]|nr:M48 family metalloprotease [Pseudomonadota bacterium]
MNTKWKGAALAAMALALAAAGPPALPGPQAISASDKALGAKSHPDLLAEYGGAYQGPQAALVTRVGRTVAAQSQISNAQGDFTFTLLNSPVENAFAVPGGYVYCTRNLLALMNDEAELAFVLGHETGHIAAHHTDQRNKVVQRDSVLGALGQAVLGSVLGNGALGQVLGGLGNAGINRLVVGHVMSHSRSEEFEADDLGVSFMEKAAYDPLAAPDMLGSLAAQVALDAKASGDARTTPAWAMSHPDPGARVGRALALARQLPQHPGARRGDAFLLALNGMIYGDDPRQGVIEGQDFLYPTGRLRFTAPAGYGMSNGTDAVTIGAKGSSARGQARFLGGAYNGDLGAFLDKAFASLSQSGKAAHVPGTPGSINGLATLSATVGAQDGNGNQVDASVVAYAFDAKMAYAFIVLQPRGTGLGDLAPLAQSLRRMSTAEAGAVRPRVISVVTVGPKDTLAGMAARMAYTSLQTERFLVLNGLPADTVRLPVGRKVKLVVWGKAGGY